MGQAKRTASGQRKAKRTASPAKTTTAKKKQQAAKAKPAPSRGSSAAKKKTTTQLPTPERDDDEEAAAVLASLKNSGIDGPSKRGLWDEILKITPKERGEFNQLMEPDDDEGVFITDYPSKPN